MSPTIRQRQAHIQDGRGTSGENSPEHTEAFFIVRRISEEI